MVTSKDVAKVAGLSQSTVSRALRGLDNVSEEARVKVLAALASTGYAPHAAARTMRTARTGAIGVVTARLTNPMYPMILESLTQSLGDAGYRMVVWNSEGLAEESAIAAIREGSVDGAIFTTARKDSEALAEAVRLSLPIVLLNRSLEGLACDQVTSENEAGAASVADYFAAHGKTRVGMVTGLPEVGTTLERSAGFMTGVARNGLILDPAHVAGDDYSHAAGAEAFERFRASGRLPEAVFCLNDLLAFGFIDAARAAGVRVPEDIWIVGYDDTEMASWGSYDLTTVAQAVDEMTSTAVRLLQDRLRNPQAETHRIKLPSELVVRRSTANAQV